MIRPPVVSSVRTPRLLFLGGNGHAPVRLEAVRRELARRPQDVRDPRAPVVPFEVVDPPYPIERVDGAGDFDAFLDAFEHEFARVELGGRPDAVYATGIGALVALALRARGALTDVPLVLQGPVLWGLETRRFPKFMRVPGLATLLGLLFRSAWFRRRFRAKYFREDPGDEVAEAFFAGYRDVGAFRAWFRWLRPELLRTLEARLAERPEALANLEVWCGTEDRVVTAEEVRVTERALGVELPTRALAGWGHYPMLDDPEGWIDEVARIAGMSAGAWKGGSGGAERGLEAPR